MKGIVVLGVSAGAGLMLLLSACGGNLEGADGSELPIQQELRGTARQAGAHAAEGAMPVPVVVRNADMTGDAARASKAPNTTKGVKPSGGRIPGSYPQSGDDDAPQSP